MDLKSLAQKAAGRKANPAELARVARRRKIEGGNLYSPQNAEMFQDAPQSEANISDPVPGDPTGFKKTLDGVNHTIGTAATLLNKGGESLTFGLVGDEAAAKFDEMIGRGTYDERLAKYRADEEQVQRENPGLSMAAEIAPALIPGVGGAKAVAALGNATGRVVAGGLAGATAAGTYGFAEGEGGFENRLKNAGTSALVGGLFGAAAPKVTDFAVGIPGRVRSLFRKSAERPTIPLLKATKNAAYKAVDDAGEAFDGDTMTQLSVRVRNAFEADNYVPETDSALTATLKLLDARAGKKTSLTQLDKLRQNLWKRYSGAKDQPQILEAIRAIDETIEQSGAASELMQAARAANARYAKSQLLDDAFTKATDQTAGSGSGGNILNKYRQAVTNIINNERKARFFSADEIDMMRAFVRGDMGENVMRKIGKLSPNGNGLMMALHVVGGVASSGATLPLMAIGAGAKASADKSVMRGAEAIQDTLAGFSRSSSPQSTGAVLAAGQAPVAEMLQGEVRNMLNQGQLKPR